MKKVGEQLGLMCTYFKIKSGFERIMFLLIMLALVCHIVGCFFYIMAKLHDFDESTWVGQYGYGDRDLREVTFSVVL